MPRTSPLSLPVIAGFFAVNALLHLAIFAWMTPGALQVQGLHDASLLLTHGWTAGLAALWAVLATLLGLGIARALPNTAARWTLAFIGMVTAGLLAADCKIYSVLGVRMDDYFMLRSLAGGNFIREAELGWATYLSLAASIIGGLLLQRWLLTTLEKRRDSLGRALTVGPLVALVLLFFAGIAGFSQVSAALDRADPVLDALPLRDTLLSGVLGADKDVTGTLKVRHPAQSEDVPDIHAADKRNIVLLLVESLRCDFATPELMPKLHARAQQQRCLLSPNHHSGGHATSIGVFSWLYGLNSYHFLPMERQKLPSLPLQMLKKQGYELVGVSGSKLRGWDHADYMLDNFDTYKELASKRGYHNDEDVLAWIQQWAAKRDSKRPFVLFVFLVSPHHNYHYPPQFERHKPVMPEDYNHFMDVKKLAAFKDKIVNRYKNSVLWVDELFSRIMAITDKASGDRPPIVALGGDHGEEFWDHGLLGHGAPRFYNARTRVPLLMCVPGKELPTPAVSSHVDVWPTVIDAVQPKNAPAAATWSNGVSLLSAQPARDVLVTGIGYPYHGQTLALIGGDNKLWLERKGGFSELRVTKRLSRGDEEIKAALPDEGQRVAALSRVMKRFLRTESAVMQAEPPVQVRVDATFGPWLKLVGYSVGEGQANPGQGIAVKWVWQCLQPVPEKWRLFMHGHGVDHKSYSNLDHVPVDGSMPFSSWGAGMFIVDEQTVDISYQRRKGQVIQLSMGLWAPGSARPEVKVSAPFSQKSNALQVLRIKVGTGVLPAAASR